MKGVVANCLGDLVKENFGQDKWEEILVKSGLDKSTHFLATQDIDDQAILKAIDSTCKVLNLTMAQAADAFGDYWTNTYAPKIYGVYFRGAKSAKELLLKLNNIHEATTKTMPNAHPPRFEYEWKNDKTLIMTYVSHRGLIDIFVSMVKGVGKYYNEKLSVMKLGKDKVQIIFSDIP